MWVRQTQLHFEISTVVVQMSGFCMQRVLLAILDGEFKALHAKVLIVQTTSSKASNVIDLKK
jgi:hypothetical protein